MSEKVIFVDIDGTLTEPGSNVPPLSAQQAVKGAQAKGNKVFLCTGRNKDMMAPLLQYGFDGYIASSGGYVVVEDELIYDCPMTKAQQELVLGTLKEHGIFCTVECENGSFTDEGFKEFLRSSADGGNSEMLRWREQIEKSLNIRPMGEYDGSPIYKVVVMSPSLEELEKIRPVIEKDFNLVIQEAAGQNFINGEIVNRQFDKGQAVKRVCEYLQVPLKDSVGFGDSNNDKEMLETAGLSIVMANGSSQMKSIADELTEAVTEDGLANAFARHKLC